MAKPPAWMEIVSSNKNVMTVVIRRWHPGFWWARLVAGVWYPFLNWLHKNDCDYYCRWVYPYGFVPEAGCPIHDKDENKCQQ